jgi:hypothetical protein
VKKLIQIIGPRDSGKMTLLRSLLGTTWIDANPLFYTYFNGLLVAPPKVCLITEFRGTPENLTRLRAYLREQAIVIHRLNEQPTAIVNDKIWVYKGRSPIIGVESLIFNVEKVAHDQGIIDQPGHPVPRFGC